MSEIEFVDKLELDSGSNGSKEAHAPKQTSLLQGFAHCSDMMQPWTAHSPKLGAVGATGPPAYQGGWPSNL